MARATFSVAATMIGAMMFGSSSRNMMAASLTPMASAATAKSRSRRDSTWPCTTRATSIQAVRAMMSVIVARLGLISAASVSSRKMDGKHSTASTSRISAVPIQPR